MNADTTYTFVAMKPDWNDIWISRDDVLSGFKRDKNYWWTEITPSSQVRLSRALGALNGWFEIGDNPNYQAYYYYHNPDEATRIAKLDLQYERMDDSDWCAHPYKSLTNLLNDLRANIRTADRRPSPVIAVSPQEAST